MWFLQPYSFYSIAFIFEACGNTILIILLSKVKLSNHKYRGIYLLLKNEWARVIDPHDQKRIHGCLYAIFLSHVFPITLSFSSTTPINSDIAKHYELELDLKLFDYLISFSFPEKSLDFSIAVTGVPTYMVVDGAGFEPATSTILAYRLPTWRSFQADLPALKLIKLRNLL